MKNLGFTLVELLGVIIILGVLVTIITVSVGNVLDNSELKLNEVQIKKVEEAAKNYYISEGMESSDLEEGDFTHCVSIKYLIDNGYVDATEVSNFETGENLLGSVRISYESNKYKYTYREKNCQLCVPVSNSEKTTGNVPQGNFEQADEYICEVKDDVKYRFFVISTEGDNVNLLMERNINSVGDVATSHESNVEWYAPSQTNSFGPVTAMNFLTNATKDWNNVTVRLPLYGELQNRCTNIEGSCPLFLTNYTDNIKYYNVAGAVMIDEVWGYWLFDSSDDNTKARAVHAQGLISNVPVDRTSIGIRPVISLNKEIIRYGDRW